MSLFSWKVLLRAALSLASVLIAYWAYRRTATRIAHRRLAKRYGCQPPKRHHGRYGLMGLEFFLSSYRDLKQRTVLEKSEKKFLELQTKTIAVTVLNQSLLGTIDSENVKAILATDFKSWGLAQLRKPIVPLLGHGIFSTDGEAWQHSRDLLRPAFAKSQIADLALLEERVDDLIRAIPTDMSTVDLQPLFFRFTLDVATQFLFGSSTRSLDPNGSTAANKAFVEAFNYCELAIGNGAELGVGEFLLGIANELGLTSMLPSFRFETRFAKECRVVHSFADSYIDVALSARSVAADSETKPSDPENSRYVLLDHLIQQTNDRIKIRSELLNILIAGRDTTASLLSNVWFELSKRPDLWSILRNEIDTTLSGSPPTYEELKDLRYLHAIIRESLRLYPILPLNARIALVDTKLPVGGGPNGTSPVFVPKGQIVSWNAYTMHRDKSVYGPDALEFTPDRWLDTADPPLRPGWSYLPFNGGPRVCIGQNFALTEVAYTTVRLVQAFGGIESRDPEPWREMIALVCKGFGGCKIALRPR